MNLKQLRAFCEVIETGSVSEAARRLHRSQPAVSGMISSLEEELGVELFMRSGLRLRPAPEAMFLLREAGEILNRVENAQKTMQAVRKSKLGRLDIASMPGPTILLLPMAIDRFLGERNDIRVHLITRTSPEVEQLVSAQNVEMGFADYDLLTVYDDDLVNFEIFNFDCLCAMRSDDPLAAREVITPQDLDTRALATLYPDHPTSLQIETAFKAAGAHMNIRFSAQYFIPLFTFVERKGVYSLIDQMSVECYLSQNREKSRKLVFKPFRPLINLRTAIITPVHRPMSKLSLQFVDVFRNTLREIQQKRLIL